MTVEFAMLIGDPTSDGWIITAMHAAAAAMCVGAGMAERRAQPEPHRLVRFWLALAAAMGFLAVNKQLDLQTMLTAAGRDLAKAVGLYGNRRLLQAMFVLTLCMGFAICGWAAIRFSGRSFVRVPIACCGIALLILFIVVRAATFHHVASPGISHWPLIPLEAAGAALIGLQASFAWAHPRVRSSNANANAAFSVGRQASI